MSNPLTVSVTLADYEPIKALLRIVSEMVEDDRIPVEYKYRICSAIAPDLATPTPVKPSG